MTRTRLRGRWVALALAGLVVALTSGLVTGAIELSPRSVLAALADRLPLVSVDSGLSPVQENILFELRLPRVVLGALVGGLLAVAGAAYQGVFRNPLADPYLLGAAAGAGLGATLVIGYAGGGSVLGLDPLPVAAFTGAVIGVVMAYLLGSTAGRAGGQRAGTASLVLAGVAVTSFLSSVQALVQQAQTDDLRRIYSFILGQLAINGWRDVIVIAPYAAVSAVLLLLHGRLLDVLSVGDEEAGSLGVHARRVRLVVLLAASLATAAAVAVSGLIGFVGIIVPHAVRRLTAGSYRVVLPLSLIGGAAFLVIADVAARLIIAPAELPIGVVTALVGAPFFIVVLRMARRVET